MTVVLAAARSLRWYVRQLTGEAKWDDYLADCAAFGERADVAPRVRTPA